MCRKSAKLNGSWLKSYLITLYSPSINYRHYRHYITNKISLSIIDASAKRTNSEYDTDAWPTTGIHTEIIKLFDSNVETLYSNLTLGGGSRAESLTKILRKYGTSIMSIKWAQNFHFRIFYRICKDRLFFKAFSISWLYKNLVNLAKVGTVGVRSYVVMVINL